MDTVALAMEPPITRSSPIQIPGSWNQVTGGWNGSMGIKSDGSLWAWGYNGAGELGTNNTTHYSSPVSGGNLGIIYLNKNRI